MRKLALIAIAGAIAALTVAFGADTTPEGSIDAVATRAGDAVSFEGFANLVDAGPYEFGEFLITEFSEPELAKNAGIDLIGAAIEELPDASGLRFIWKLSQLPNPVPPELVRYTWVFTIDDQSYQLQAKSSNLASVTTAEAPVDHVLEASEGDGWFQLRGACEANYMHPQNPISGCYHLGFFEGQFDTANAQVVFDLPYEALDRIGRGVAQSFTPGSKLVASASANMSVAATLQAGVSNTSTAQYMGPSWGPYFAGTYVEAGLGFADEAPSSFTALGTPGDGSFAGTLAGEGDTLYVRACRGGVDPLGSGPDPCVVRTFAVSG